MSETKWTHDTWHAATTNDILYVIAGAEPALNHDYPDHERRDRVPLARVYDSADSDELRAGEGDANARLMAAAPDMYEALESRPIPGQYASAEDFITAYEAWADKARAALRRAVNGGDDA